MILKHKIGEMYRYPERGVKTLFKLVSTNGFIFRFECGHWCTDSVFMDLIRVKTGVQVYKDNQMEMELI